MNFIAKMAAAMQVHTDLIRKFPQECKTGPCVDRALKNPDPKLDGYCTTCQINHRLGILIDLLSGSKTINVHASHETTTHNENQASADMTPVIDAINNLAGRISVVSSAPSAGTPVDTSFDPGEEKHYTPETVKRDSGKVQSKKPTSKKTKRKASEAAAALNALDLD